MLDLRSLVLGQTDLPMKEVIVPEWKDENGKPLTLYVKSLTAGERDQLERARALHGDKFPMRANLTARTVVDKDGNRVFSDNDIEALDKKSGAAMDRIVVAYSELNNFDVDALEKKD